MGRKKRKALFPGSFDPPTVGHKEVIRQGSLLFDELLVGLAEKQSKAPFFPAEKRLELLRKIAAPFPNVRVVRIRGLTARWALQEGVGFLLRAIRNGKDVPSEIEMAYGNEIIGEGLKTVFLLASGGPSFVSSSLLREVYSQGGAGAAKPFLPEETHQDLCPEITNSRESREGMKNVYSQDAPSPAGPYSQAVDTGRFVFLSGQIGLDPETGELSSGGVEAQTGQALRNTEAVLQQTGLGKEDVVKVTVYLTNMGDFGAVNEVYEGFFGDLRPARTAAGVSSLPKGALVEIEAIACREDYGR